MDTPFLYYPVKQPINPNNLFGATSPMYTDLKQLGHPGVDFECVVGTPVHAPCDGDVFFTTDKDGGCGLWERVPNNGTPQFNIILWHMVPKNTEGYPYSVATDGSITHVKAGQLLGYSGNSGFPKESTGPHLHLGVMPCDATGEALEPSNGFLGCVDPTPYFNGLFAQDIGNTSTPQEVVQDVSNAVTEIAQDTKTPTSVKETLLQEIAQLLERYL